MHNNEGDGKRVVELTPSPKPTAFTPDMDEFISGLVVTVLQDVGPVVEYNRSSLNESEAFGLSVKGFTALGHTTQQEVFGPLPVQNREDLQALAFLHTISTKDTMDDRLAEFGRPVAFWLIFESSKKRQVLHASGIVQSYLTLLVQGLDSEKELTQKRLDHICERITTLVAQSRIRVFGFLDDALIEFNDESLIPLIPVLVVADGRKKNLYVLHIPGREPRPAIRRKIGILVNELNRSEFRYRLQIVQITNPAEVRDKLDYYNIESLRLRL